MKTSYFANLKNVSNPLSISGKAPDWYTGPQCKILAPKWEFFNDYKNGVITADEYTDQFYKLVLKPLNVYDTYHMLIKEYGEDVTLLCYEKPGQFCHRRIVATWFEEGLGVDVPELELPTKHSPLLGF